MGRRNEHSREQQREMALAAAELLLVREGIGGLSMRKVASNIGYTVGNLYLLFSNQDDLLASINERTADAIHSELRKASERLTDPRARLRVIGATYIEFAQKHPARWRLLFEHQLPEHMQPRPSVDSRIKRLFDLVEDSLRKILPHARPTSLRVHSTALWSAVHGICSLAATGKLKWSGLRSFGSLGDHLVDTFLAGLQDGSPSRRKTRG